MYAGAVAAVLMYHHVSSHPAGGPFGTSQFAATLGKPGSYIGSQPQLDVRWTPVAHIAFDGEIGQMVAGPIIKPLLGKAVVPDDSPYTTGGVGLLGTSPSQDALADCDTLIIAGSSFPYLEFYPKPGKAKTVQIDLDPARIGLRHPAEVGLVGDCRDVLNASQLLDLYGVLGVPVQVSLAYPSAGATDPKADTDEEAAGAGRCRDFSPQAQADWASTFASLALCKSFVSGVFWDHLSDAETHRIPQGGLVDARGGIKPAFDRLRLLREGRLK